MIFWFDGKSTWAVISQIRGHVRPGFTAGCEQVASAQLLSASKQRLKKFKFVDMWKDNLLLLKDDTQLFFLYCEYFTNGIFACCHLHH